MNEENRYYCSNYEKIKCIWMASQIVEYKLCDNRFECESCMFDKAMRNIMNKKVTQSNTSFNIADIIAEKLRSIKYDENIIYLKNNLIAKEICANTFYLGIDPILNSFIDNDSFLTVNDNTENIETGQQLLRISGEWGAVSISSPLNIVVYDKLVEPNDSPLKSQWFAIIGMKNQERFRGRLSPEKWEDRYLSALNINDEIKSEIIKDGSTMMDGGTQIKSLHKLLGNKKYVIVLNVLIAQ